MASVMFLLEREGLTGTTRPAVCAVAAPTDYDLAFAELHARAYATAYKLLGDRAEAEDVAQEALARAYLHWAKVSGYAPAWVVRVSSNLAIGSWRKRRRLVHEADGRERERETDAVADGVGATSTDLPDHLELRAALASLPGRQREVVVLRHLAGFSERETAQALGCSAGSVKQHSTRGLAALRHRLRLAGFDGAEEG